MRRDGRAAPHFPLAADQSSSPLPSCTFTPVARPCAACPSRASPRTAAPFCSAAAVHRGRASLLPFSLQKSERPARAPGCCTAVHACVPFTLTPGPHIGAPARGAARPRHTASIHECKFDGRSLPTSLLARRPVRCPACAPSAHAQQRSAFCPPNRRLPCPPAGQPACPPACVRARACAARLGLAFPCPTSCRIHDLWRAAHGSLSPPCAAPPPCFFERWPAPGAPVPAQQMAHASAPRPRLPAGHRRGPPPAARRRAGRARRRPQAAGTRPD